MLPLIWFVLLGALLAGYAILDGFDLGVGILHPVARNEQDRGLFLEAIGPVWDGNEVWLVTFGGALFAAFPEAYATSFSAFYEVFMLVLFSLILRAVSLDFRSKVRRAGWRRVWDAGFFLSSLLAALLFGLIVGNALLGISLDQRGVFTGSLIDLLRPYPLLVALLTASLFAMHGAIYLYLRTAGKVQEQLHGWLWHTWGIFLALYLLTTIYALVAVPRTVSTFDRFPWAAGLVVVTVLALANIPRSIFVGRYFQAFISSSLTIALLVTLFGLALFPNLITASNEPAHSLTIYNAASSSTTLAIMLVVAAIGMPFVLAYTTVIYWTFRGKVRGSGY